MGLLETEAVFVHACACVSVCVRERETERKNKTGYRQQSDIFLWALVWEHRETEAGINPLY